MKKKIAVALLAVGAVLGVAGCVPEGSVVDYGTEYKYKMSNGTLLDCLDTGEGITCDWGKEDRKKMLEILEYSGSEVESEYGTGN